MARGVGSPTWRAQPVAPVIAIAGAAASTAAWATKTGTRAQQTQRRHPSRQASPVESLELSVQASGATTVSKSVVCTAKTASQMTRKSRTGKTIPRRSAAARV
jgi:hypothetical protein